MKRFLLLSLMLHALLFTAVPWDGPVQPGTTAPRPLSLRLAAADAHDAPAAQQEPAAAPAAQSHRRDSTHAAPPQQVQAATRVPPVAQAPLPAPTQTSRSATADRRQTDSDQVHAAIRSALLANFSYPRRARMRGWEGTVVIALHIMPAGEVRNVRIANSSGIDVLDQAALRALREVRIPQAVAWLGGREMDMMIPVEYRLTDG